MATGNSHRSWLPEMLEILKKEWNTSLSWEQFGALCERLTELRTKLRKERGVKGPRMYCRHCNGVHEDGARPRDNSVWTICAPEARFVGR